VYAYKDSVAELKNFKLKSEHDNDEGAYLLRNSSVANKKRTQKSILLRQAYYVLPITILLYIILEMYIHIDTSVCNYAHVSEPWVWIATFAVSVWFAIHMVYMLIMIRYQSEKQNAEAVAAYWGSFAIAAMAGSSGWLTLLVFKKSNFCIDYFGYV